MLWVGNEIPSQVHNSTFFSDKILKFQGTTCLLLSIMKIAFHMESVYTSRMANISSDPSIQEKNVHVRDPAQISISD